MSETAMERVAASVRAEAARQRKTPEDLSKVMDVSRATVYRRLNGELEFTVGELTRLAAYFRVPIERLLGDEARAS